MVYKAMRDVFFSLLYEEAKKDRDIILLSVDLGAPSLDEFRENLPGQFINIGISEQNAILVAAGMALRGKKVFVYGITEFITLRCLEQIKLYVCGMNLPIVILGIGSGLSFSCDGMTHHSIEQISIIRTLPNIRIVNCSDNTVVRKVWEQVLRQDRAYLILFEKEILESLWGRQEIDITKGFSSLNTRLAKIVLVSTGIMSKEAVDLLNCHELKEKGIGIIDVFCFPMDEEAFLNEIGDCAFIITMEENVRRGGLGSYILEVLSDNGKQVRTKRFALDTREGYKASYNYPKRDYIRQGYGLDKNQVLEKIKNYLEENGSEARGKEFCR